MSQIKGVLLDSGDTLVKPKAGSWFPRQHFTDAFLLHGITDARMDHFDVALAEGLRYLDDHHAEATTEEVENRQFRAAYRLILEGLGVMSPSEDLIADIVRPFEDDVGIKPFPDTVPTLEALRERGIRLGIVTDNWPSIDRRYREMGLRDYFDAFVISAIVGCSKPCSLMYRTAVDQISLPQGNLLFVDDSPTNVERAISEGMQGVVITRYGRPVETNLPIVSNLREVVDLCNRSRRPQHSSHHASDRPSGSGCCRCEHGGEEQ